MEQTKSIKNSQFQNIVDTIISIKEIAREICHCGHYLSDTIVSCPETKMKLPSDCGGPKGSANNFVEIVLENLDIIKVDLLETRTCLNNLKQETETSEVLENRKPKEIACGKTK